MELTTVVPAELQCHVWNLLHSERLKHLHMELKQKVVLTEENCWWFKLRHRKNKWKRRQDSDYWEPNLRKQLYHLVALDDIVYLNSCKKCFLYKNSYYYRSRRQLFTYKLKKEVYDTPCNRNSQ